MNQHYAGEREREKKKCDLHSISGLMYPLQSTVQLALCKRENEEKILSLSLSVSLLLHTRWGLISIFTLVSCARVIIHTLTCIVLSEKKKSTLLHELIQIQVHWSIQSRLNVLRLLASLASEKKKKKRKKKVRSSQFFCIRIDLRLLHSTHSLTLTRFLCVSSPLSTVCSFNLLSPLNELCVTNSTSTLKKD